MERTVHEGRIGVMLQESIVNTLTERRKSGQSSDVQGEGSGLPSSRSDSGASSKER